MVLTINPTGLLAGVGANPLAGKRDNGTGPFTSGKASMDRLGIIHLPSGLAARIARLLTSDASAMIHLPHQRDALWTSCLRENDLVRNARPAKHSR